MPDIETPVERLARLGARTRALQAGQHESIIAVGAGLEIAYQSLPDMKAANELVGLALEGLRAIYEAEGGDIAYLTNAVADAMEAAGNLLAEDSTPDAQSAERVECVLAALHAALAGPTEPTTDDGRRTEEVVHEAVATAEVDASMEVESIAPMPLLTPDDVAALLVQVDASDRTELARAAEALGGMAGAETAHSVTALLEQAADCLRMLGKGLAAQPEMALAEAGSLLEQAANERELPQADSGRKTTDEGRPATDEAKVEAMAVEPVAAEAQAAQTVLALPPDSDVALIADFITESRDYIRNAEAALLALEVDPTDNEAINTVFRAFHTIKGTSLFLGLQHIADLAHRAESLLSRMRDKLIICRGGYADLALRSVDVLTEVLQLLQDALGGEPLRVPDGYTELVHILDNPEAAGVSAESVPQASLRVGDILVAQAKAEREDVDMVAASQGSEPIGVALVKANVASVTDVAQALRTQQQAQQHAPKPEGDDSSIRIRTERLDRLIDTVGELVIAHSLIAQDQEVLRGNHYELGRKVAQSGKIVRELQDISMSMRMVPLKATFQKMARLVRDLAQKSGKQVNLVVEGEDTEIDRNMVDVINDPLVHMVRNSMDHGIEPSDVRTQAGKTAYGTLRLSATHAGGNIVVTIQDDGRGLNREKIIAKAVARGMIESGKTMTDGEVYNLIFEPGFSTADQVTDISGRGVGMDVVRRAIQALRGRIIIQSTPGQGSTFTLQLPLTLAITDGMLVKVGLERYILPTYSIQMSFQPAADMLFTVAGRGEMVMLRGELMAIFRLHRLFSVRHAVEDPTKGLLVVVSDGEKRCALLVDELLGQQQVVAKSLGEGIGKIPGVSGGAILGDGRIGLILDAVGIVALARQGAAAVESRERAVAVMA